MTIMLDLSKVILVKMIGLKTLMMIKSILMKTHQGHQSLAVHLKPRNRVRSSDSSGDNDNDEEEGATPQHGGGLVAVDSHAGCRHVWTHGGPAYRQGLRR